MTLILDLKFVNMIINQEFLLFLTTFLEWIAIIISSVKYPQKTFSYKKLLYN